jgi:deazaflavin-dependent oxidoreductase (nitroreductase family)
MIDLDRVMGRLNPAIAWLLRSPLRGLADRGLLLVTVTGRRSGRRYTIPVGYLRAGDRVVVLVSKASRKQWWRNYREPVPVELWLRGEARRGVARLVPRESPAFRESVETILRRLPWLRSQLAGDVQVVEIALGSAAADPG